MLLMAMTMGSHRVFAQSVTITLMPGWNWISCPMMDTLDFETAMGSVTPVAGDIIKSRWGSATYTGEQWRGTISQFYPGYGYHYMSNRTMPVFLTFNAQQPTPQVIVTTMEPTDITAVSAISGGSLSSTDGSYIVVLEKGICWATHPNPMVMNDSFTQNGNGPDDFTAEITDLSPNTIYFVRAYAVSANGTTYGNEISFITQDGIPEVSTNLVTNILGNRAICSGTVVDDGGLEVMAKGVCWSTNSNPTISDNHTVNGDSIGDFTSNITGLALNTTYYVRAYASTSYGTGYGEEVSFTTLDIPAGAMNGLFSVSETKQVYFSFGNLQYQTSTYTWHFAENQWDYVGSEAAYTSETIDLFAWGTSGYNHGAVCYQPYSQSCSQSHIDNDYYAYGNWQYNLFDQTGQADWGYNAISNGGNQENSGWRTLTKQEWNYLINNRSTISGIRWAQGSVNNKWGTILLPDNWDSSLYELNNPNGGDFYNNIISEEDWINIFDNNGAIFLPAAGQRYWVHHTYPDNYWSSIIEDNVSYYWTSSASNPGVYCAHFTSGYLSLIDGYDGSVRCNGYAVRLVKDYNP